MPPPIPSPAPSPTPLSPLPTSPLPTSPSLSLSCSYYVDHAPLFNAVRPCVWALTANAALAAPATAFAANALQCPGDAEVFVPVLATAPGVVASGLSVTVTVSHLPPCAAPSALHVDALAPGAQGWANVATLPAPATQVVVTLQLARASVLLRVVCVS